MTKRLLILIMALLLVCASCLADEQVVVDSFKVHVQDIMQPVLATYKKDAVHIRYFDPSKHGLQGSGHWFKVRNLEPVYSLDVKKNVLSSDRQILWYHRRCISYPGHDRTRQL